MEEQLGYVNAYARNLEDKFGIQAAQREPQQERVTRQDEQEWPSPDREVCRLDRIMVYARGESHMANHYARNRTFCAQTFANGDPAHQSQASFDQVSDEGVHFCHVHL